MTDVFLSNGATAEGVETNTPDVGHMDPLFTFSPDQGLFVRILAAIAAGSEAGVPVYMKLRDTNGNLLPVSTEAVIQVKRAGEQSYHDITERLTNIAHYNQASITKQRNVENIDSSKLVLQYPEGSGKQGSPSHVDIRDIDDLAFSVNSSTQADPAQCEVYVDNKALEGAFSR